MPLDIRPIRIAVRRKGSLRWYVVQEYPEEAPKIVIEWDDPFPTPEAAVAAIIERDLVEDLERVIFDPN